MLAKFVGVGGGAKLVGGLGWGVGGSIAYGVGVGELNPAQKYIIIFSSSSLSWPGCLTCGHQS